jgi:hypothetical protein
MVEAALRKFVIDCPFTGIGSLRLSEAPDKVRDRLRACCIHLNVIGFVTDNEVIV